MKLAILCDTHHGLRNASDIFLDYTEAFYRDIMFPYCEEHKIKDILHLGDFFDNRKYVNIKVLNRTRKMFLEPMTEKKMFMTIIPGNHDVMFKHSNEINSLKEVLGYFKKNVRIVMQPEVKKFGSLPIALLPWIAPDNQKASIEFINSCPAPILAGHLEMKGFEMIKGLPVSQHGLEAGAFKRFEAVYSGHYHTRSSRGNIHYLGTQFEHTWSDCGDPKYFHILDTETRELTKIVNPKTIFHKFQYDDELPDLFEKTDFSKAKDSYIKIIVINKSDAAKFDSFLTKINQMSPIDVKIIETFDEFTASAVSDETVSLEDTHKLLDSYIEAVDTDLDKGRLKRLIQELYIEAQQTDTQ